ncbi:MAG: HlyD family efflux transporter periplasmic adaptor subunit [Candidatus Rokubacteria bacterium]|nr:HlyD family efflux transporter periplasmic adaptor subunit [Candidatus Rokubacteria bacterium]
MDHLDLDQRTTLGKPGTGYSAVDQQPPDGDRGLWAAFAEAATTEAFCQSWLALQCRMIDGVSGGLVLLGPPDRGSFSAAAVWPEARQSLQYLTATAKQALSERRGLLLRREPGGPDGGPSRERYEVAYPIEVAGRLHGVIVLDVVPRPEPQLQAVLRRLHWGAAWLEVLFRREEAARDEAAKGRLQMVLDLAATTVSHERFSGAAMAFVTALATRLECDRASIGFVRAGRVQVRAVSHSAHFGKQTNLIRAIGNAMDEALDQQGTIVHPAPRDGPPRVTRAHMELARQHGSGAICSIPLSHGDRLVGALTLERPGDRPFDPPTVELCEAVAAVAGPVLEIQRRDDRWLATKAVETCRTWLARLIGPHYVALKLAVVGAAAVVLFFAGATGDFRVSATTTLEPEIRRAAVAPFNGYIAEARVRAGDLVRQGQVLCALDDREMRLERLKWLSQHEQLVKQYRQAMAKRDAAQVTILTAQIDQAKAQLSLLEDQLSRTRVLAPFNGVVVTGDLSQMLGSPVERGQVLFEVAPLDAYRVILQVDERDVADVAVGQKGQLLLSAFPEVPLPFRVEKITPVSTAQEGRNYFRVEAQLESTPERLRPGMEGVGKVEVGRRLLVWIWTRQVIDWVRLKLWTWMP